jgi:hypothetical protein
MLKRTDKSEKLLCLRVMARTQEANVAPLDTQVFLRGVKRVFLNWENGGIVNLVPSEEAHQVAEPNHTGPTDEEIFENEEVWNFDADLEGVIAHMNSFPFIAGHPDAFKALFFGIGNTSGRRDNSARLLACESKISYETMKVIQAHEDRLLFCAKIYCSSCNPALN